MFYDEDSWVNLTEDKVEKIIHARCKVLYVAGMLEGIKKYVDSFNSLIKFME